MRYPVGVGRAGKQWPGPRYIDGKYVNPAWSPPADVSATSRSLPDVIPGGSPHNPMGVAAMTLSGGEYAIHGTNKPGSIGGFVSYGCIRMYNQDITDLFARVGCRHHRGGDAVERCGAVRSGLELSGNPALRRPHWMPASSAADRCGLKNREAMPVDLPVAVADRVEAARPASSFGRSGAGRRPRRGAPAPPRAPARRPGTGHAAPSAPRVRAPFRISLDLIHSLRIQMLPHGGAVKA